MFTDLVTMLSGVEKIKTRAMHRKAAKDLPTKEILNALDTYKPLPIKVLFAPNQLVTQRVLSTNPETGEPSRRFSFPLPGQPARVVGMIDTNVFEDSSEGDGNGYNDLLIAAVVPEMPPKKGFAVREYLVSSRYFRAYVPGETVEESVAKFIDSQVAKPHSEEVSEED